MSVVINFEGKKIKVPEVVTGKELRKVLPKVLDRKNLFIVKKGEYTRIQNNVKTKILEGDVIEAVSIVRGGRNEKQHNNRSGVVLMR